MKLQILSDLHLEFLPRYSSFNFPQTAPNLALLGDIGLASDSQYLSFLQHQLSRYSFIFLVLGNHEPYGSSWHTVLSTLNAFSSSNPRLILLNRARWDNPSEPITILGCTLFSHVPKESKSALTLYLNDFHRISGWTVDDHDRAHGGDLEWLNKEVERITESEPERRIVVLTHHSPTNDRRANDPRHDGCAIGSGFITDLRGEKCWAEKQVKMWAFGHTHFNCTYVDEETGKEVVTNQRGYSTGEGFDSGRVYKV